MTLELVLLISITLAMCQNIPELGSSIRARVAGFAFHSQGSESLELVLLISGNLFRYRPNIMIPSTKGQARHDGLEHTGLQFGHTLWSRHLVV